MLWIFCVVAHGTGVVVLVFPLKEFCATSETTRGVFGYSSLLGWGNGCNGGSKWRPVDGGVGGIVPLLGPVFGDGGLGDVVVDLLFVEASLFVGP